MCMRGVKNQMTKFEISIGLNNTCNNIIVAIVNKSEKPILLDQLQGPQRLTGSYSRIFYSNDDNLQLVVIDASTGKLLALGSAIPGGTNLGAQISDCKGSDSDLASRLLETFTEIGPIDPPDIVNTTTSTIWLWLLFIILVILLMILALWINKNKSISKPGPN